MTQELLHAECETEHEIQSTETDLNHEWQEDIEHLTDVTTELNRTDAAVGLLLLNSPKSTHIDTEEEELVENELLMPIGGEKQPDIVLEMEQQNRKRTSASATNDSTTLASTTENQEEIDSGATFVLDTPDE